MRDEFPLSANRGSFRRRSSFGLAEVAEAELGALARCGDDIGGGGETTPTDNSTFTGGSGGDTHNLVSRVDAHMKVDAGAGDDTGNTGSRAQAVTGGLGVDTINDGTGDDVAVFTGARTTCTVARVRGATSLTDSVVDSATRDTSEGADTLSNIEKLRFGDSDGTNVATVGAVNNIRGNSTAEMDLVGNDRANTDEATEPEDCDDGYGRPHETDNFEELTPPTIDGDHFDFHRHRNHMTRSDSGVSSPGPELDQREHDPVAKATKFRRRTP